MKFCISLLALSLLQGTNAFSAHQPKSFGTALNVGGTSFQEMAASYAETTAKRPATSQPTGRNQANQDNRATTQPYRSSDMDSTSKVWEKAAPIILQGGSLRTWSESTGAVERVQVLMKTEGRPLNANIELWHGPDNTPLKMAIYSEDGLNRPINVFIETPTGQNTIAIRNTGQMEFPLTGAVEADPQDAAGMLLDSGTLRTIQGGAIHTYPFDHTVASVQVLLKTGGRPLNSRIELLQGPNNDKFVIDVYTEDGLERPFYAVIETPGTGNVVRIVNTATVEFPLTACVQPYLLEQSRGGESGGQGWDNGGATSNLPRGRQ
jgi:hypothetical protein